MNWTLTRLYVAAAAMLTLALVACSGGAGLSSGANSSGVNSGSTSVTAGTSAASGTSATAGGTEVSTTAVAPTPAAVPPLQGDPLSFATANYSVAQGSGSIALTVLRVGDPSTAVSIDYATNDGTAVAGTDYTATSGTLHWAENDSIPRTITVPVSAAQLFAGNKSFAVSLSNPSASARIGSPDGAVVTIVGGATNSPGAAQFASATYTVNQSADTLLVSVNRTGGARGSLSVTYSTSNGTAVAGVDFTATSGTLSWADSDATTKTFSIPISGVAFSGAKTFGLALAGNVPGLPLTTSSSATAVIIGAYSAAAGTFYFSSSVYPIAQNGGALTVLVNRALGSSGTASVAYSTYDGTAVAGTDYTATSGTLVWADGDSAAKLLSIPIQNGTAFSGDRAFTIRLSNPGNGADVGDPGSASVVIAGTASPAVGSLQFGSAAYTIAQSAGTGYVTVNRIGGSSGAISAEYFMQNGTAVAGVDFTGASGTLQWADGDSSSKTIPVVVSSATPFAGTKSLTVQILSPTGGALIGGAVSASVAITGDEATSPGSFQITTSSVATPQDAGTLTMIVNRTGGSSGPVAVNYATVDDSAVGGTDYTISSGTLSWADGDSQSKTVTVNISNAVAFSGIKTFAVVLSSPTGGATLGSPKGAVASIYGSGAPAASTFQMSSSFYPMAQNAGVLSVLVSRTGDSSGAVSVTYSTVDGSAVGGTDYTPASGTLNWVSGDVGAKIFSVAVSNANPFSGTKSFTLALSNPTAPSTLGTPATATVTIIGSAAASTNTNNAAGVLSLLGNLNKGSGPRVLSGQHAEIWNADVTSTVEAMQPISGIAAQTGVNPAILGLVLNYATESYAYTTGVTATLANQWWSQGGLVELSLYSNDPTFSFNSTGEPIGQPIPASAFHTLTDKSSAAYAQWHAQLDTYAAALHALTDSGNVILFRPFIELNGNWNWYGAENPADFIAVWQDMHDYLMVTKGLKNLLWIYNVNDNVGNYMSYYPGANYVDIVGMDIYDAPQNIAADANNGNMYSQLVATGKPLIMPEVGLSTSADIAPDSADNSQIIDVIRNSLPNVVGFVVWCQGFAIDLQNNPSGLMNDPWVINSSNMPALPQ